MMDVVSEDAVSDVDAITSVEQCECPPTYEGLSCEVSFEKICGC